MRGDKGEFKITLDTFSAGGGGKGTLTLEGGTVMCRPHNPLLQATYSSPFQVPKTPTSIFFEKNAFQDQFLPILTKLKKRKEKRKKYSSENPILKSVAHTYLNFCRLPPPGLSVVVLKTFFQT